MTVRRRPGTGSIYQRADGKWVAQLSIGPRGSRRFLRRTHNSQSAARKALAELREARLVPGPSRLTTAAYLERWIADVRNLRPNTQRAYAIAIRYHLVPEIGDVKLRDLSPIHIERMLGRFTETLSPRSARNTYAVLRRALNAAVRQGILTRNVASRQFVDAPRVPSEEPRALSADELRGLLDVVKGDVIEPIVTLAAFTGLRQGELLGLAWEDLELGTEDRTLAARNPRPHDIGEPDGSTRAAPGSLHVRRELVRRGGRYYLEEPKTPRSRRTVPLIPQAVKALQEHRSRLIADGFIPTSTGLVFVNRKGSALNGTWVTHRLQRFMEQAGIREGDFRMLRRTFASRLFAQGIESRYIADLLGHAPDSKVTQVHYVSTGSDAQRMVAALEELA